MRTWAVMVRDKDGYSWSLYEYDENKGYIAAVARELRDGGTEAGIMEII